MIDDTESLYFKVRLVRKAINDLVLKIAETLRVEALLDRIVKVDGRKKK